MARTLDAFPGERFEEGIIFDDRPSGEEPTNPGGIRYVSGSFSFLDSSGSFNPRSLTKEDHKILRQLIHMSDNSGPFEGFSGAVKICDNQPFSSGSIWYTDAALISKIIEKNITRNSNKLPTTISWNIYDIDGSTILTTATDTIEYMSVFEVKRTRVIT